MRHRLRAAALALAAALAHAAPLAAGEFTLLVYETEADLALRADAGPEGAAYWALWGAFADGLAAAGAMRGGAPLHGLAAAAPAPGLALGGYFVIEAADRAAAEALAAGAPSAARGGLALVAERYPAPAM